MTDHVDKPTKYYNTLQIESNQYGDIHFQKVRGGITFGIRLLYHMVFAVSNYDFDYFLRVDDDYFMCFQNFLSEIPLPPLKRFHWGWVHRTQENMIRPEESMLMLSRDLVETFLLQDANKMLCHPWGDQMIGVWSNTMNISRVWRHDNRLWHHPPARDVIRLLEMKNICRRFIGLHGAYPEHMKLFWRNRGKYKKRSENLLTYSKLCPLRQPFDWHAFSYIWHYKPKLCITDPVWDTSKQQVIEGSYTGREEG